MPGPRSARPSLTTRINAYIGKRAGQRDRLCLHLGFDLGVAGFAVRRQAVEHLGHQAADVPELGDAEAARGAGRRADADARRDLRLLGIERHAVLVGGDVGAAQRLLRDVAGELLGPQVDQQQVRVGAARHQVEAGRAQHLAQRLGVLDHGARVGLELGLQRLAEGHRLGGDDVHQRPALHAREHGRVDLLGQRLVVGEDHGAARARAASCASSR